MACPAVPIPTPLDCRVDEESCRFWSLFISEVGEDSTVVKAGCVAFPTPPQNAATVPDCQSAGHTLRHSDGEGQSAREGSLGSLVVLPPATITRPLGSSLAATEFRRRVDWHRICRPTGNQQLAVGQRVVPGAARGGCELAKNLLPLFETIAERGARACVRVCALLITQKITKSVIMIVCYTLLMSRLQRGGKSEANVLYQH